MKIIDFICRIIQRIAQSIRAVLCWFVVLFTLVASVGAQTQTAIKNDYQSLASIYQAAKLFLQQKPLYADKKNVEIKIGRVDPRLRLKSCDGKLEFFTPQGFHQTGKTTLGAHCVNGLVNWKLFIPVTIYFYDNVWVTSRSISTGEVISKTDLHQQRVRIDSMRKSPVLEMKHIVNASPTKYLKNGAIIFHGSICLVCKGQKVGVNAQTPFVNVFVKGIALKNAALGEITQIKNSQSKRIFTAIVTGKNQLRINLSELN